MYKNLTSFSKNCPFSKEIKRASSIKIWAQFRLGEIDNESSSVKHEEIVNGLRIVQGFVYARAYNGIN